MIGIRGKWIMDCEAMNLLMSKAIILSSIDFSFSPLVYPIALMIAWGSRSRITLLTCKSFNDGNGA